MMMMMIIIIIIIIIIIKLTTFHAIKDFNSALNQAIRQSVNVNIFKRNRFKFVTLNGLELISF